MESSILISTKKVLGISENYTTFDQDIITYINSAFASLSQLGVTPAAGFFIEDASAAWDDLAISINEIGIVKTYICLKTRMLFDPPATSFLIDAVNKQITEHEWRLAANRETNPDLYYVPEVI